MYSTHHPEMTVRTAYDLKPCHIFSKGRAKSGNHVSYINNDFNDPHLAYETSIIVLRNVQRLAQDRSLFVDMRRS